MKLVASAFVLLFLAACDSSSVVGIKAAAGDTPVKYVICAMDKTDCFVAARFKYLDSCQSYKTMTCKQDTDPKAIAYCTL